MVPLYRSGEKYGLYHYGCQSLKSETDIYNASKSALHQKRHSLNLLSQRPHSDCLLHRAKISNELPDKQLLAVSPECNLEAMKALWSTNTFSFAKDSPLRHWLRLTPQNKLVMIRHLRLEMWMQSCVTTKGSTLAWAQAIKQIPGELPNLVSVNVAVYLSDWLTCWRESQTESLASVFKPLNQLGDLRSFTVVFNEDIRVIDGFHITSAWGGGRRCEHSFLRAQGPGCRRQIGNMWAEGIRALVLH